VRLLLALLLFDLWCIRRITKDCLPSRELIARIELQDGVRICIKLIQWPLIHFLDRKADVAQRLLQLRRESIQLWFGYTCALCCRCTALYQVQYPQCLCRQTLYMSAEPVIAEIDRWLRTQRA